MPKPKQERRAAARVPLQLQASMSSRASGRKPVELRDMSSRGLFFFTQAKVEADSQLEIVLMMPPELQLRGVPGTPAVGAPGRGQAGQWVCCRATVVRIEEDQTNQKIGIAAVIDRCEALPEI